MYHFFKNFITQYIFFSTKYATVKLINIFNKKTKKYQFGINTFYTVCFNFKLQKKNIFLNKIQFF